MEAQAMETGKKQKEMPKLQPVITLTLKIKGAEELSLKFGNEHYLQLVSESRQQVLGPGSAFAELLSRPEVQELLLKKGLDVDSFVIRLQQAFQESARNGRPLALEIDPKGLQAQHGSLYVNFRTPSMDYFENDMWNLLDDLKSGSIAFQEGKNGAWRKHLRDAVPAAKKKEKQLKSEISSMEASMSSYRGAALLESEEALGQKYERLERMKNSLETKRYITKEDMADALKDKVEKAVPEHLRHKYLARLSWATNLEDGKSWIALGLVNELLDIRGKGDKEVNVSDFLNLAYEIRVSTYVPLQRGEDRYTAETQFNPQNPGAFSLSQSRMWADGWKEYGVGVFLRPTETGELVAGTGLSLRKFALSIPLLNLSRGALPFERGAFDGFMFGFGGINFAMLGSGNSTVPSLSVGSFYVPLTGSQKGTVQFASPYLFAIYAIQAMPELLSVAATAELPSLGLAAAGLRSADYLFPFQTVREITNVLDLLTQWNSPTDTRYHEVEKKIAEVRSLLAKSEYNDALAIMNALLEHAPSSAVANPFVRGCLNALKDRAIDKELIHFEEEKEKKKGSGREPLRSGVAPSDAIHDRVEAAVKRLDALTAKLDRRKNLTEDEEKRFLADFTYLYMKLSISKAGMNVLGMSPGYFKDGEEYGTFLRCVFSSSFYFNYIWNSQAEKAGEAGSVGRAQFLFGLGLFARAASDCDPLAITEYYDALLKTGELKGKALNPATAHYMMSMAQQRLFNSLTAEPGMRRSATLENLEVHGLIAEVDSALKVLEASEAGPASPVLESLKSYLKTSFDPAMLMMLERYMPLYSAYKGVHALLDYSAARVAELEQKLKELKPEEEGRRNGLMLQLENYNTVLELARDYQSRFAKVAAKTPSALTDRKAALEELSLLHSIQSRAKNEAATVLNGLEDEKKMDLGKYNRAYAAFVEKWGKEADAKNITGFKEWDAGARFKDVFDLGDFNAAIIKAAKTLMKAIDSGGASNLEQLKAVVLTNIEVKVRNVLDELYNLLNSRKQNLEDLKARIEFNSVKFKDEDDRKEALKTIESLLENNGEAMKQVEERRKEAVKLGQKLGSYADFSAPLLKYDAYLKSEGLRIRKTNPRVAF